MKRLKPVQLFADPDEFDRFAGNMPHRQRSTAARIAIELGQHHTGQRQGFAERLRDVDRILPCIASTTNKVSTGLTEACKALISSIIASSIARRLAVSTITTSKKWRLA